LRNYFSQSYVSAFGAGTCGNINDIDVSQKKSYYGFPVSEHLGTTLGETILHDLTNLTEIAHPSLAAKSVTLTLPLQTFTPEELAAAKTNMDRIADPKFPFTNKVETVKIVDLANRVSPYPAEIQVFRLDDETAIACLPAEIFVEFGLAIKKASPFKTTFVIALANDRPSYMPTLKAFTEGAYEVINSRYAPGGGEKMTDTAIQLLKELKE
jgi:neutral ceramidase